MQKSFLQKRQKTWVVAGIAFLCSALWGSAFAGVKIGYELFQIASADWAAQMVFAGIRFAIAGVMALVGGSIVAKQALILQKQTIPKIGIISLFQTILQYFFYYIGLAHTTGVNAAIIVAANVFIAILLSTLVYRIEKMTAAKLFGCVIGFLGIILCNLNGLKGGIHLSFLGDGFIFLCTVASGFSSVLMKKYPESSAAKKLLKELLNLFHYRKTTGLVSVIWILHNLVYEHSGLITAKIVRELDGNLFTFSQLESYSKEQIAAQKACAALAYRLKLWKPKYCGAGVDAWEKLCSGEIWNEVKNEWLDK